MPLGDFVSSLLSKQYAQRKGAGLSFKFHSVLYMCVYFPSTICCVFKFVFLLAHHQTQQVEHFRANDEYVLLHPGEAAAVTNSTCLCYMERTSSEGQHP